MDINIDSQIVVKTEADWALDTTVYSEKRLLITSDAFYSATDQRKFKIPNGVDTWNDLEYFPVSEVSGGQLAMFTWKYSTNTTAADPGTGFFRGNNSSLASITQLYVDDITTTNQVDISDLFAAVGGDWLLHIQQRNDATKWVQFTTTTEYTDNTGWWTIPVTFAQQGSGGAITNATECLFVFINKNVIPNNTTIDINGVTQEIIDNPEFRTALADTGALTYGGLTAASTTQVNIGAVTGYIVDNETDPDDPSYTFVNYAGESNKTVTTLGSGQITYVLLDNTGTIVFQNTFPTSAQRKTHIYLSKISHPTGTISVVANEVDYITSPQALTRDLFQVFNYLNSGIFPYASNADLTWACTAGSVWGNGINFITDDTNPNEKSRVGTTTTPFFYRTQTGVGGGIVTNIDPANYDVAGTITAVGGGANASTIQYVFAVPFSGGIGFVVQYGQTVYNSLNEAISFVGKEASFTVYPNLVRDAILVGVLCVTRTATDLTDTTKARFFKADKLGQIGGSQAGIATGTLQTAYNNSIQPEVLTDSTRGAVTVRRGSAADSDNVLEVQNGAGTVRYRVTGDGHILGSYGMTLNDPATSNTLSFNAELGSFGTTMDALLLVANNGDYGLYRLGAAGSVRLYPSGAGSGMVLSGKNDGTAHITISATGTAALSNELNEAKGSNITAASTTDIGAATGNLVHITGSTTITSFGTVQAGTRRILVFDNSPIITHNSTSLILPGAANISASTGDVAVFVSEGSGNWRCVSYQTASEAYTNYTPTWTGYSAAPTVNSGEARWKMLSRNTCHVIVYPSSNGTSNATTMTITLPFNAANIGTNGQVQMISIINAGAAALGNFRTRLNSNIADVYTAGFGNFTGSGVKAAFFSIIYQIEI